MRALLVLLLLASSTASAGEWPQFHADPLHTGAGGILSLPLELWWKAPTRGPIEGSPVVGDGRVFVGSTDGRLYAFDAVTGTPLWTFEAEAPITSAPALSGGVLYLLTTDGRLFAIEAATGQQRLHGGRGNPDPGPSLTSPSIHEGRLFVGTEGGMVVAYSLQTLTQDWAFSTGGEVHLVDVVDASGAVVGTTCEPRFAPKPIRSSPAVYDEKVFFGGDVHALFALDEFGLGGLRAGSTRGAWSEPAERACAGLPAPARFPPLGDVVRASPAVDPWNGLVIVASFDNTVRAFKVADGTQLWNYTVKWQDRDSRVVSTPAVLDGKVYFGSFNRRFYALETTPQAPYVRELWNFTAGDAIWSSPAVAGGLVAFGADDETLYVLDSATGRELWRHRTGDDVRSSPAIADGVLYAGGSDGSLYAFGGAKPPRPDLRVAELGYPRETFLQDLEAPVRVTVDNAGNSTSPATEAQLFIDGALAATWPVPPMGPGNSTALTYLWLVPAGSHSLRALVDPGMASREFERANNELQVETPVAAPPPPPPPPPPEPQDKPPAQAKKSPIPAAQAAAVVLVLALAALAARRR